MHPYRNERIPRSIFICFIDHYKLSPANHTHVPYKLYQNTLPSGKISILVPGKDLTYGVDCVGTTPAAIGAYIACTALQPDLIINAGTAGGFRRNHANIGDCFIGKDNTLQIVALSLHFKFICMTFL